MCEKLTATEEFATDSVANREPLLLRPPGQRFPGLPPCDFSLALTSSTCMIFPHAAGRDPVRCSLVSKAQPSVTVVGTSQFLLPPLGVYRHITGFLPLPCWFPCARVSVDCSRRDGSTAYEKGTTFVNVHGIIGDAQRASSIPSSSNTKKPGNYLQINRIHRQSTGITSSNGHPISRYTLRDATDQAHNETINARMVLQAARHRHYNDFLPLFASTVDGASAFNTSLVSLSPTIVSSSLL